MRHPVQRRPSSLFVLLGVLAVSGSLLLWQRSMKPAAAPEQSIDRAQSAAATDPLGTPDFLGKPSWALTGNVENLAASLHATASRSLGSIQSLKKQKTQDLRLPPYTIPVAANAPTNQALQERQYAYRRRELEAYRKHTADQGAARVAGEAYLEAYLKFALERSNAPTFAEVRQLAKAALEAGSRDPMIRAYAANTEYQATKDRAPAERCWAEVLPELARSKYPRVVTKFVRFLAYEVADREQKSKAQSGRRYALLVATVQWLQEESADPKWLDCVFEQLLGMWEMEEWTMQTPLLLACLQSEGIDPALLHALLGDWHITEGWLVRGASYASEVKPEAWAPFGEHMKKAAVHLQYSWSLRPEIPFAANKMIIVCKAGFDDQYRPYDWFLRSVEARLDYWPVYWSLLDSLRPRWGGTLQSMVDFAQNCLDTDRFDTFLPYIILDFLPDIQQKELENDPERLVELELHPLLSQFLRRRERYRQSHPGAVLHGDTPYYRTRLALLLDQFDLPADAAAEFGIDENFDVVRMQEDHRPGIYLMRRLFAAQGDVRPRVLAFDEKLRSRWPADTSVEALASLKRELAELRPTATHPRAELYYQHAEQMLHQLEEYVRGDWTHLDLSKSGPGWEATGDQWWFSETEDEVKIDRSHGECSQVWLRPLLQFVPPFEVEAVIEQIAEPKYLGIVGLQWARPRSATPGEWSASEPFAGVQVVTSPFDRRASEFATFSMSTGSALEKNWTQNEYPGPRRVSMKLWPQAFEAVVDGSWRITHLETPLREDGQLRISEPFPISPGREQQQTGAVRVSAVRIRKVTASAPPQNDASLEEREAYWLARTAIDADDLVALLQLCAVRVEQKRFEEALKLASPVLDRKPNFSHVRKLTGRALFLQRRYAEALAELTLACDETYDDILSMATLGELLAAAPDDAMRDGQRAKGLTGFANSHSRQADPVALAAYAAAAAETASFEEARSHNRRAIDLTTDMEFKEELQQRQALYEAGQPFRLPQ